MTTLFVRKLTVIDCSYLDARRGLVGESWHVDVELDGDLNEQGMLFDFGHVKKTLKKLIDSTVDHGLLIPTETEAYKLISEDNDRVALEFNSHVGQFKHASPLCAIQRLPVESISPEAVAQWLEQVAPSVLPENVKAVRFHLHHEIMPADQAHYHYSHGLQQHDGNCQRIAHGHRSKIEIFMDGERDTALEAEWAEKLRDIYIGTTDHLTGQDEQLHHYAYQAPQGGFELTIPARHCYLMDTETTVELIACHLADQIKAAHPDRIVKVKAFEGVGKGALAER